MSDYTELKYLRDELNQRLSYNTERVSKTITTILVIWGGALGFLGYSKPTMDIDINNIPLFFMIATIFFISNIIVYTMAHRYQASLNGSLKLAAYITVFYEQPPNNDVPIGKNFCWELANLKQLIEKSNNISKKEHKNRKSGYECNTILTIFSSFLMAIFTLVLCVNIFADGTIVQRCIGIFLFVICLAYCGFSFYLLGLLSKIGLLTEVQKTRCEHLSYFIDYSNRYAPHKKSELKKKFGDDLYALIMNDKDKKILSINKNK